MTWPKRILVVYNGAPESTSGRLFTALAKALGANNTCWLDANPEPSLSARSLFKSLRANMARAGKVLRADVLVLHSYVVFSLPSLLLARLAGTRVVVFQWDIYPSTLAGRRLNQSRVRAAFDWIETRILTLAHTIVVPSADFLPFVRHRDVRVMPIWPTDAEATSSCVVSGQAANDAPWRLCFAGQVTPLRALDLAADHLYSVLSQPFELHVFSDAPLPQSLRDRDDLRIVHHGYLSPEELKIQLCGMHFGLISLHPDMDQPGFPSKVFDMIAAGLPVLYFGRPLPGFTSLVERSRIGIDITSEDAIDLAALHERLISSFPYARAKFFAETQLDAARLKNMIFEHTHG